MQKKYYFLRNVVATAICLAVFSFVACDKDGDTTDGGDSIIPGDSTVVVPSDSIESKVKGKGVFTLKDYASNSILGQVQVDEAKFLYGNTIYFYNEGEGVDLYLNMYDITAGEYWWCEYDCSGNYFYTQKGVTAGIMWYARKGTVLISQDEGGAYSITLHLETNRDAYDSPYRVDIEGYYQGYLTVEE